MSDTDLSIAHARLHASLRALPVLTPSEDRLAMVLQASAAPTRTIARIPGRWRLLIAVAASIALGAVIVHQTKLGTQAPPLAQVALEPTPEQILIATSQQLEAQLYGLGQGRASLRQLASFARAQPFLIELDAALDGEPGARMPAPRSELLWRQRVAVLQAVQEGNLQSAAYQVD
jgi:hypothetical protein